MRTKPRFDPYLLTAESIACARMASLAPNPDRSAMVISPAGLLRQGCSLQCLADFNQFPRLNNSGLHRVMGLRMVNALFPGVDENTLRAFEQFGVQFLLAFSVGADRRNV